MNDPLARFATVHNQYRARITWLVQSLSPEEFDQLAVLIQANVAVPSYRHLPDEYWPIASRVRAAVQKEIVRRAAEAVKAQEVGS